MATSHESETGCCPRFDPTSWDEQVQTWKDKLFIKDRVRCLFYIPLNFGKVITRNMQKVEQSGVGSDHLMLSDCNSLWGLDLYLSVEGEVPETQLASLSGTFLTKVFEGPYKDVRKWMEEMKTHVEQQGSEIQKMYFYYTTCPKCAKVYGKNYVVIFAQIENEPLAQKPS